ncbi:MAG TPA: tetratricopeptide repeat protein [Chloroflexota bacterium]
MEVDDLAPATEFSDESRRARRRQLSQQAISLAMQSRWQEAADVNQQLVELVPDDAEAYNRLGKAFAELGRIDEARAAYEQALRADPANLIAQRNLDRLSRINQAEAAELLRKAGQKLDPNFFMEETGKTGVTVLENVAPQDVLLTLTAGDRVQLQQRDGRLEAVTTDGTRIGDVEERLAMRLTRLMQSGNQYQAGVVGADENTVRIIIREIYQAPENVGRISFPPRVSGDALPRPYLRGRLSPRSADEEEDEDIDSDIPDVDADEDEEEDPSAFGFTEGTLDET